MTKVVFASPITVKVGQFKFEFKLESLRVFLEEMI
jgi:hypothetical protein